MREEYMTKDLAKIIGGWLKENHHGKENAVTNSLIRANMQELYGIIISEYRLRKVINYIRLNNIVPGVCSTNIGYFVGNNEDILACILSLKKRIYKQQMTMEALENQLK